MGRDVKARAEGSDVVRGAPGRSRSDGPRLTWQDRIYAWRDRMCASPRFQHWVATFPLTRRIAQKHARNAFDLCAGFVYSQILAACIELDLLAVLFERPQTALELSARCSLPLPAMERLLAAAAALDLVSRRAHGRWGLGTVGAGIAGSPGLSEMIRHHVHFYADLRDPVALLRGQLRDSQLSAYWAYAKSDAPSGLEASKINEYSSLMASSQAMISRDIVDAYLFSKHRRLLDVGGGKGAFVAAVADAEPKLELSMFDLPAVADLARATLAARGLGDRVEVLGGDFFRAPLPRGADVMSLVRILHDHDDGEAMLLLRNIHAALPPGGALLIAEPMAATTGGEVMGDAYFGLYLMAMGSGRPRTAEDIHAMLRSAGFKSSRILRTARPMLVRVIAAAA
jgi:demethylspheroidene O-methyltransferase